MPFKDMMLDITPGMEKTIAARYNICYIYCVLFWWLECIRAGLDNSKFYLKKLGYFETALFLGTILSPCLFCAPEILKAQESN